MGMTQSGVVFNAEQTSYERLGQKDHPAENRTSFGCLASFCCQPSVVHVSAQHIISVSVLLHASDFRSRHL